ncbi:MAG TPA: trypsin-like peptidase domain-containing protein [Armatimonadota bacterium]|jgi:hypothetical protein
MRYTLLLLFLASNTPAWSGSKGARAVQPPSPFCDAALYQSAPASAARLVAPDVAPVKIILPATVIAPQPAATGSDTDGLQIGYVQPAPPNLLDSAAWLPAPDGGSVMKVELTSANAGGLRVQLAGLGGTGIEVRPYAPGSSAVFGPYQPASGGDPAGWWSPLVFGDTFGLELHLPAGKLMPLAGPVITGIVHTYCNNGCNTGPGATLACHLDSTCYPAWAGEASGVAKIIFQDNGGCFMCSGSMLNRNAGDSSPLFLTANHCINNAAAASTVEFLWFYQTPACNGTPPDPNTVPCTLGSLLLKNQGFYDCSLIGLYANPPGGVQYEGWTTVAWGTGDAVTGIHHPRGSWKRISFGTFSDSGVRQYNDNGQIISVSVWLVDYSQGTIEPGSSGSPLFDSSHHVRGPLTGGPGGCTPSGVGYGRLDLAYDTLSPFLNSVPSPVYVSPGGGGGQRGTSAEPLPSVFAGMYCVKAGDTVVANAGVYSERETLFRPMRITAQGGIVRIGG